MPSPVRLRDRLSLAIGGAALVTSVLVIGGALRWTQAIVAGLVALALLSQLGSRRRLVGMPPLILLFLIAIGLTALQLIPLPDGVLHALTGKGNELRTDGALLAGTAPWHTISLDSAGTLHALGFLIILLGVAVLGLRIASSERGRYYVLAGVAMTCGLAALVTGLHTLLNLDSLYGVYAPQHATPPILGPLLNPNHLGGLMAIGATVSVGLVFYQRQAPQLRVLWVVLAVGCSATAMVSLSRGATLALALGVITTIALLFAGRLGPAEDSPSRPRRAVFHDVPITIVIAIGLAVAVYTSAGRVADQLDNTTLAELNQPLSKYQAWRSSFDLVEEAPWVGIGRGALEPAFTRVHDASAYITFSHLENEYVQAIVEWGVPGGLAILLGLAWCISIAAKRWRDGPLAACAIGACGAIMFQNSVDFSVELLGVAVPALLVGTTLLSPGVRETRAKLPRLARAGVLAGLAAAVVILLLPATSSIQEDHDWLTDHDDDATMDDLREVMTRHPLDYLAYGKAAALGLRTGDASAAKFLNHALQLHPTHPGLHRLAARTLIASGRKSQGAVEYSLALHGSLTPKSMVQEIVTLLPDAELAASAIPVDAANPQQILRSLHELERDDIAERWLLHVVTSPHHDLGAIDQLYQLAMDRHDYSVAEHAARRRLAESHTNASRLLLARVMFREEQFDQVLTDLADVAHWTGRIDEQVDAWLLLCDTQIEKRAWDPALQCLHKLDGSPVLPLTRHYEVTQRISIVSEHRTAEAKQKAIEELERALGSVPKPP